jgi:hypothetical protein
MTSVAQRLTLEALFMHTLASARESGDRMPVDWFCGRLAHLVIAAERQGRLDLVRTPHPGGPDFYPAVARLAQRFDPLRQTLTVPRSRPDLRRWAA